MQIRPCMDKMHCILPVKRSEIGVGRLEIYKIIIQFFLSNENTQDLYFVLKFLCISVVLQGIIQCLRTSFMKVSCCRTKRFGQTQLFIYAEMNS